MPRLGRLRPSTRLQSGDRVVVGFPVLDESPAELDQVQVPILYEDEDLLAVDKGAGLLVQPNNRSRRASLIVQLRERHPAGGALTLTHRLDRETSGVVLVAKNPEAARSLHRAFAERRMEKHYLAVVQGEMEATSGILDFPLGRDRVGPFRFKQTVDPEEGRRALTRFRVVRRIPGHSLVDLRPLTGRQHQIRVHLACVGHPVVGDKLYGPDERLHLDLLQGRAGERRRRRLGASRHLLHAAVLSFEHPLAHVPLSIRAPLPSDMREFLAAGRPKAETGTPSFSG